MNIPEREEKLRKFMAKHLPESHQEPHRGGGSNPLVERSDEEIIAKARSERNGKFERLWGGGISDYDHDHSDADDGFIHKLYSYTQDEEQIKRIHAMSGLHRPEKSGKRADYLQRSINRARKNVDWFYEWPGDTQPNTATTEGEDPPKPPAIEGRILLGKDIKEGIEPPDELVPGVLLTGRVTSIYSGPGMGKTFLMLWIMLQVIEQGLSVVLFDMENGRRIIAERLELMGADPDKLDKHLQYYSSPSLPLTEEVKLAYETLLDEVNPALVIYDSWINFLASAGLDENVSNDIATWAVAYTHPARDRGISVLLLDHVPKEGISSRGSGRKKDEVDVMWKLANPQPFDRETVGQINLIREKDREGWLPERVGFSVGGGDKGFVFKPSDGTLELLDEKGLKRSDRRVLDVLEQAFGPEGAKAAEWQRACKATGVAKGQFYRSKKDLEYWGWVKKVEDRFCPQELPKIRLGKQAQKEVSLGGSSEEQNETSFETSIFGDISGEVSERSHNPETGKSPLVRYKMQKVSKVSERSQNENETDGNQEVSQVSPPYKGETVRPTHETPQGQGENDWLKHPMSCECDPCTSEEEDV